MTLNWLENLKVGDEVFISRGSWGLNWDRKKVERITKSQIIIGSYRFNKRGQLVGSGPWSMTCLVEITPETEADYRFDMLIRKAKVLKEKIVIPTDEAGVKRFIFFANEFVRKEKGVK
jgi:hypothetical protein